MLDYVPWFHWAIIGILSLVIAVFVSARNKCLAYGSISLFFTVCIGITLLEMAIVIRWSGILSHASGINFEAEYNRLFHGGIRGWVQILSNVVVFIPFGFFFSEFLASTKRFSVWHQIQYVTLAAFGLSLFIECLQLILHVGFFELTDLVMNTIGGFFGAGESALIRLLFGKKD